MEKTGLIPILVELLKIPPLRGMMLKMLYQVSQDEKAKGTFTYTEAIPLLYELLIRFPEGPVGIELVALVVNLSSKERNAQLLAKGNQYEKMVKRAIRHSDALLFKVVRNIAQFANDMVIDVLEVYILILYIYYVEICRGFHKTGKTNREFRHTSRNIGHFSLHPY